MAVFLLLGGTLTCGFFLYVLVQFHNELRMREKRISMNGRARHSPSLHFLSSRRVCRKLSFTQGENSEKVPLVETAIHIMVPRDS